ncbi:glycosyltransferase family 4 protein [Listeria booriae]|uniref:glycosyltransferase family 4 protein n=1 Tax=Listeria booriae TaxID=1552123 RepID=UPI0005697894|nr:glycosyltransferase family 4 protein [Listeria booriae]STY45937.1 colanic acid biosynthesis glycosyltransferase WcaL [Listeria booriae]
MINQNLQANKVFMFSSVHVWSDTRIFFKEAMTLVDNGFTVDFHAVDGPNACTVEPNAQLQMQLLPRGNKLARPKRWRELYQKALASDALYYHFHDFELLFLAPKIKKRKPNCKIIYDMHENFPAMLRTKEWIPALARKPLSKVLASKEKKWMPACDAVIFAETSYKKHYEQVDVQKVDILNLPTWQEEMRATKEERFTFVYVGDIVRDRGVFDMLALVRTLKDRGHSAVQLKLIGPMQPQVEQEVTEYIRKYGLEDTVITYGRIPYTEIWQQYASAHVGLCLLHPIPNYMHSLATKLFEYMAAGLPILATDIPDWKALLETTDTGLTANVWNAEEVAEQAEKLMRDPALRQHFALRGRKAFETMYNWQTEADKLVHLYRNLHC